jgi:hypothetical protein
MAVLIVTVNSRAADLTIDGLGSLRDATQPVCGICAVPGKTNEETAL